MRSVVVGAALALAVIAAVLTANFVLLGYAVKRSDPVGRLTPVTHLGPLPVQRPAVVKNHGDDGAGPAAEPDD
jgi:hypothetical protein